VSAPALARSATAAPDAPVILEVQGLAVDFPSRRGVFRAVEGVDLALRAGRTLAVVGESGSGKSVTARAILQILDQPGRIAAGRVLLHRHLTAKGAASARGAEEVLDLAAMPPRSAAIRAIRGRDIAMIFQEPMSSLSPVHTIGAQIIEAIRLHDRLDRAAARARAVELLRQVEIPRPETAVDRYTFEFSGGMRQRAMIAMALACNPGVLIADEPTTALDVTTQAEILDLIRRLQASHGMAVMLITHDMGVVAEMADEVVVMRHGQIVERGAILEVFEHPKHDYTRMLLDAVRTLERPSPRRLAMRAETPPGAPILRIEKARKEFPARRRLFRPTPPPLVAVNDVTLELRAGEALGIVGESGSGKTTLGRCVMGLFDGLGGQIRYTARDGTTHDLIGRTAAQLRPLRREIRLIFQDPFSSLNPRMTVEQIIAEPMRVNGTQSGAALRARVAELLALVGLPESAMERYPHAFSGGQRQRIGIARAIALDPRIIVADEPTSALDVSLRSQVLDLLLDLQERLGLSFVFISHDIGVIRYFCDRVAVMYRGRVVEIGETEAVCNAPQHAYTRALLSAVPHPDPRRRGLAGRHRYSEEA
jgi:peptide/nickel transport system ATP-binding protein